MQRGLLIAIEGHNRTGRGVYADHLHYDLPQSKLLRYPNAALTRHPGRAPTTIDDMLDLGHHVIIDCYSLVCAKKPQFPGADVTIYLQERKCEEKIKRNNKGELEVILPSPSYSELIDYRIRTFCSQL